MSTRHTNKRIIKAMTATAAAGTALAATVSPAFAQETTATTTPPAAETDGDGDDDAADGEEEAADPVESDAPATDGSEEGTDGNTEGGEGEGEGEEGAGESGEGASVEKDAERAKLEKEYLTRVSNLAALITSIEDNNAEAYGEYNDAYDALIAAGKKASDKPESITNVTSAISAIDDEDAEVITKYNEARDTLFAVESTGASLIKDSVNQVKEQEKKLPSYTPESDMGRYLSDNATALSRLKAFTVTIEDKKVTDMSDVDIRDLVAKARTIKTASELDSWADKLGKSPVKKSEDTESETTDPKDNESEDGDKDNTGDNGTDAGEGTGTDGGTTVTDPHTDDGTNPGTGTGTTTPDTDDTKPDASDTTDAARQALIERINAWIKGLIESNKPADADKIKGISDSVDMIDKIDKSDDANKVSDKDVEKARQERDEARKKLIDAVNKAKTGTPEDVAAVEKALAAYKSASDNLNEALANAGKAPSDKEGEDGVAGVITEDGKVIPVKQTSGTLATTGANAPAMVAAGLVSIVALGGAAIARRSGK